MFKSLKKMFKPATTTTSIVRQEPEVLALIRKAQDGQLRDVPYKDALAEIKMGHKKSHWIWYVWPALGTVRSTSR
eukprot:m.11914 g.11914  ORF g.11914 m.11914 type:complete len:75 (+) comp4554_c0_seq1:362-586(+)